jgi:hypothetical protein
MSHVIYHMSTDEDQHERYIVHASVNSGQPRVIVSGENTQ